MLFLTVRFIFKIVAVAGIDDAASVAIFGIIASIMFSTGSMAYQIAQAPVCVIGGLAFGKKIFSCI